MALPSWPNQSNITTFNEAAKHPDSKRLMRLKLKRRYVNAGVDTYDANWTTITSDVISIGDINYGIDDQDFISGVIKNPSLDLTLDNTNQQFNDLNSDNSYWNDATTDYYIANSLVELELGYEAPDGTEYYAANPYFTGLIRIDSVTYDFNNNTVDMSIFSKLNSFRDISVYDIVPASRRSSFSGIGFYDNFCQYVKDDLPSDYELTCTANFPRNDVFYKNITEIGGDAYSFFEDFTDKSGSIFGINRSDEIFLSYFGNTYVNNTQTTLEQDSNTISYWKFNTIVTGPPAYIPDQVASNHLYLSLTTYSLTSDKFGNLNSAMIFEQNTISLSNITTFPNLVTPTITSLPSSYSYEVVFKWNNLGNRAYNRTSTSYIEMISSSLSSSDEMFHLGWDKDTEFNLNLIAQDNDNKETNSKKIPIGDDQWYYFTAIRSGDTRDFYLNGTQIFQETQTTDTHTTSQIRFNLNSYQQNLYIDSMKLSNVALSLTTIKNKAADIYNSKLQINDSTTSTYTFYNHGENANIFEVKGYDKGYTKIGNTVNYAKDQEFTFRTQFGFMCGGSATPNAYLQCQLGDQLEGAGSGTTRDPLTPSNILSFFNDEFDNVSAKVSGLTNVTAATGTVIGQYGLYDVEATLNEYRDLYKSNIAFFQVGLATIPTTYLDHMANKASTSGAYGHARFNFLANYSDYIFQDTASIFQYGKRSIDFESDGIEDLSQTANLALSYLEDKKTPKERMTIRARFLEGDIDILNRITLDVHRDIAGDSLAWEADAWDAKEWTEFAGALNWETKDFWVIGITHNWQDNFSEYKLREV
jgi:hypothetical protein